jgi:RNA polymerase sigma-70 factor (ECF subfamily)
MPEERVEHWCEPLYRAKAAGLLLYGRALGLSHGEAEDVLQDLFVCLLRMSVVPDQPERYCVRAYRNRALNYHRGLWRRLVNELESRRWFERSAGETPVERAMMAALAGLPAAQREVIVLKIWHRHTFEEIAAVLDESPNTVAGRYRYGLRKLRNRLTSEAYEQFHQPGESIEFLEAAATLEARG